MYKEMAESAGQIREGKRAESLPSDSGSRAKPQWFFTLHIATPRI